MKKYFILFYFILFSQGVAGELIEFSNKSLSAISSLEVGGYVSLDWMGDNALIHSKIKNGKLYLCKYNPANIEDSCIIDFGELQWDVIMDIHHSEKDIYFVLGSENEGEVGHFPINVLNGGSYDAKNVKWVPGLSVSGIYIGRDNVSWLVEMDPITSIYRSELVNESFREIELVDNDSIGAVIHGEYYYYTRVGGGRGRSLGIFKKNMLDGKREQVTNGDDVFSSITCDGKIFFIRRDENDVDSIMTISAGKSTVLYEMHADLRVKNLNVSCDGSYLAGYIRGDYPSEDQIVVWKVL